MHRQSPFLPPRYPALAVARGTLNHEYLDDPSGRKLASRGDPLYPDDTRVMPARTLRFVRPAFRRETAASSAHAPHQPRPHQRVAKANGSARPGESLPESYCSNPHTLLGLQVRAHRPTWREGPSGARLPKVRWHRYFLDRHHTALHGLVGISPPPCNPEWPQERVPPH